MLRLFLSLRYLRKKKILLLSVIAVALSAALLIVVASLFNGFISAFEQSAVEAIGDIVVYPPEKIINYSTLIDKLEKKGSIKAATAVLSSQGLIHLGRGNVRAVRVNGIEPEKRQSVTGFKESLIKQNSSKEAVTFEAEGEGERIGGIVGIGVVAQPDEKTDEYDFREVENIIGTDAVLTTGSVSFENGESKKRPDIKRKTIKFTITDIVYTGVYDLDKNIVYLPIKRLQEVLYTNQEQVVADQIQIKLQDKVDSEVAIRDIKKIWSTFAAKDLNWGRYKIENTAIVTSKEMQSEYVAEIRKQMGILLLIFTVVSLSVVVLIFCIFYMIVDSRQRDIAIIKSFGGSASSLALVFVSLGVIVGITGGAVGVLWSYVIVKNINAIETWISTGFGLKLWKSSIYLFSKIPNQMDWSSAGMIVFYSVLAAALGALIPAVTAARSKPVDILRYE